MGVAGKGQNIKTEALIFIAFTYKKKQIDIKFLFS